MRLFNVRHVRLALLVALLIVAAIAAQPALADCGMPPFIPGGMF